LRESASRASGRSAAPERCPLSSASLRRILALMIVAAVKAALDGLFWLAKIALVGVGAAVSRLADAWVVVLSPIYARLVSIDLSPHRRAILTSLATVALVLFTVLGEIDRSLRALHDPGGTRFGANTLGLQTKFNPGRLDTALDVWSANARLAGASMERMVSAYVGADLLFVLAYATLFGALLIALASALSTAVGAAQEVAELRLGRRGLNPGDPTYSERLQTEIDRVHRLVGSYVRLARFALAGLLLLALVDVVEDLTFAGAALGERPGFIFSVLSIVLSAAGVVKLVLVALVGVASVLATIGYLLVQPRRARHLLTALVVVRTQLFVLVFLYASLFISDQAVDALRRWRDDWSDALVAIILLGVLAALTVATSRELLCLSRRLRGPMEQAVGYVLLAAIVALAGALGWLFWGAGIGLLALAIVLAGVAFLSASIGQDDPDVPGRGAAHARRWLPAVLGLAVAYLPALAVVRAAVAPIVLGDTSFWWLALPVGALALIAWVVAYWSRRLCWLWVSYRRACIVFTTAATAFVLWRVFANPWRTAEAAGTVGLLTAFLVVLSFSLYWLARRAERVRPLALFAVLRLQRTPVVALLLLWLIVAGALERTGAYYDARRIEDASERARALQAEAPSVAEAFRRWQARSTARGRARPLLLVAAAGGGIRAAYWTGIVLTCVLENAGPAAACEGQLGDNAGAGPGSMFAASGISGGSLGLAAYVTHLRADRRASWPHRRLDDDYVAPTIAWGLFADLPSALIGRRGGSDRAEILERAFERSWLEDLPDRRWWRVFWGGAPSTARSPLANGLLDATADATSPIPILLLSGTKVQDGCRLNVSVLDVSVDATRRAPDAESEVEDCLSLRLFEQPDTPSDISAPNPLRASWSLATSDDLIDYLCDHQDIRLSSAVLLSARFPYVVPSGRLERCPTPEVPAANIVDGGYFDTSGASPLVELWGSLEQTVTKANRERGCIIPYFLQIDTGYADPAKPGGPRPPEALVPPLTLRRARDAREGNARQAAALLFSGSPSSGPTVTNRYAHVYPRAHPGVRAPLGWTLSRSAQQELDEQLTKNAGELRRVRRWLAQSQSCS
jgi:hypothetical protein